ncbi:hypothetical protein [Actinokineospora diospyrosa]|uniref:Uncharacterized protein n=1 Tax=Actinokineospora diospyrosa TaxID=103728 RepID=A0ABT1IE30_9PSEU|nr:hypothetical protein [Actinokineospora diospyrosa]MCP2270883.1 hypothetical protein [Actinokineospora diospyrosa]
MNSPDDLVVRFPADLPELNQRACRALLAILVELTTMEPPSEVDDDS